MLLCVATATTSIVVSSQVWRVVYLFCAFLGPLTGLMEGSYLFQSLSLSMHMGDPSGHMVMMRGEIPSLCILLELTQLCLCSCCPVVVEYSPRSSLSRSALMFPGENVCQGNFHPVSTERESGQFEYSHQKPPLYLSTLKIVFTCTVWSSNRPDTACSPHSISPFFVPAHRPSLSLLRTTLYKN